MACDYDEKYIIFSLLEIFVIIYIYIFLSIFTTILFYTLLTQVSKNDD
jgi:hypothetical protein